MCGFLGLLHQPGAGRAAHGALLGDLRARGPDGEGVLERPRAFLLATRLAIQGDERGAQPLRSEDGRMALVFNGEVLGETRRRLARLAAAAPGGAPEAGAGDAPLLLAAIRGLAARRRGLDGTALPGLLEGSMGAFALVDLEAGEAWLVRDRMGIKPCFVAATRHGLAFSSLLRPLLRLAPELRRPDVQGLADLLALHRPARRWPLHGVEEVPPGAAWRVGAEGVRARRQGPRGIRGSCARAHGGNGLPTRALGAAIQESVRAALEAVAAPWLLLSGGLDSGAVAVLGPAGGARALTGRFAPRGGDLDESATAAATARAAGLAHEVLDLEDADLVADLPAVVAALEAPLMGPGALALWRLFGHLRGRTRVVLTGTGGDELLAGYVRTGLILGRRGPWTAGYESLAARIDAAGADLARRRRAAVDRSEDLAPLLDPDFLAALPPAEAAKEEAASEEAAREDAGGDAAGTALDLLVHDEVEGTLPALLHVEDRLAGAHGLEARPVLCLGGVPAAAARLPEEGLLGPDGEGKRALRALLAGRLPDAARLERRKRGFPTPFARAATGAGRPRVESVLHERRFAERGWWNVPACREALRSARPAHDRALFALLSWEFWARAFLDGDALGPTDATG